MRKCSKKIEPLLYLPLSREMEARLRKTGHGHLVKTLRNMKVSTIKGLMRASQSGPVFKPGGRVKVA